MSDYYISEPKSHAFIRIPWDEVHSLLVKTLHEKYGASGKIEYKTDYGCYEGIGDAYTLPGFVDVYFEAE